MVCIDQGSGANGVIVTALPNATIEFTTAMGQVLGLFVGEAAELLQRHRAGQFVPELLDGYQVRE